MYSTADMTNLQSSCGRAVETILENKNKYINVARQFNMPWEVVGAIHSLEGSLGFNKCLHNGERIIGTGRKTRLVPKGRGPFDTWEDAAIDALEMKRRIMPANWTVGNTLDFLERYNGLGYRRWHKDVNSPYLWSGTSYYTKGKYVSDGKWSSRAVSKQVGAVPLLINLGFAKDI